MMINLRRMHREFFYAYHEKVVGQNVASSVATIYAVFLISISTLMYVMAVLFPVLALLDNYGSNYIANIPPGFFYVLLAGSAIVTVLMIDGRLKLKSRLEETRREVNELEGLSDERVFKRASWYTVMGLGAYILSVVLVALMS